MSAVNGRNRQRHERLSLQRRKRAGALHGSVCGTFAAKPRLYGIKAELFWMMSWTLIKTNLFTRQYRIIEKCGKVADYHNFKLDAECSTLATCSCTLQKKHSRGWLFKIISRPGFLSPTMWYCRFHDAGVQKISQRHRNKKIFPKIHTFGSGNRLSTWHSAHRPERI